MMLFVISQVVAVVGAEVKGTSKTVEPLPEKRSNGWWIIGLVMVEMMMLPALLGLFAFAVIKLVFAMHGMKFP